ncbi:MAG: energy transducer TonB [Gammaproteobacteria bacterium]|nr:energy transducer TonB [Gammaproteobacteria bacterium]
MKNAAAAEATSLSGERFGFTMFVSICIHGVIILGVGFGIYEQANSSSSLEITLAQYRSQEAPEEADFLAQENQQGSGSQEEKAAPSTPVESRFNDDVIQDVSPFVEPRSAEPQEQSQVIATEAEALEEINEETTQEPVQETAEQPLENLTENQINDRLASLQAQLDIRRQAYAKRPRRYTISSASTEKARDALYLDNWRKKVEAVGNLHYPSEASTRGIYGNLRLLVSLRSDGTVSQVRVLSSSGHEVLDKSAIRIVHLAAPFDAFPEDLRQEADILDIIRTWQFQRNNSLISF